MPREHIKPAAGPFAIDVAWSREHESVELAVTTGAGFELLLATVNEWLRAANMATVDVEELRKNLGAPGPWWSGLHTHMQHRREVNELIYLLRRARDGAFGKDA
jgi:hypothetical protein